MTAEPDRELRLLLGGHERALVRYVHLGGDGWEPVDAGSFKGLDADQVVTWTWNGRIHRVLADKLTGLAFAEPAREVSA